MGEKGEGFTGTIIKDTWTVTRGRVETGEGGGEGWGGWEGWGKGRKLYSNNNKKMLKKRSVYICILLYAWQDIPTLLFWNNSYSNL